MNAKILWADDEIDLLKPHIMFLEQKGYEVVTVNNGVDAVEQVKEQVFDVIFLDENMPGMSGLEALAQIKNHHPETPVVMITKSEEESIMDEALGSKISDYLIKPVNPNQILLSLKKQLDNKRLVNEKTSSNYQQEFRQLGMRLNERLDFEEWAELYKQLIFWELELEKTDDAAMKEIFIMQLNDANNQFSKFIEDNYEEWLHSKSTVEKPIQSHTLLNHYLKPILKQDQDGKPVFLIVIDNLRYDQWLSIKPIISQYFRPEKEDVYYSILPTATQYSRNAIFAGLMPSEMERRFPKWWKNDEDEGGKNLFENEFLLDQIKRWGMNLKSNYAKITNNGAGKKYAESINNLMNNDLNVLVYNFVDMLSHARTEMEVIRELADDESAYRSITVSWFEHSPLHDAIKQIAKNGCKVLLTTDHGTICVNEPSKVMGYKNTNSNLRYKQGKSLDYNPKDVFEVKKPSDAMLPKQHLSSSYIFATGHKYFVYPNNYNHFVNYYKDTFQHGGISLEEVLIPAVVLNPK
ncbi:MAG: CheY-like chemotaxis protein [Flavobacteriales bacterium]|jgi:CheY-like chemotaxis protein